MSGHQERAYGKPPGLSADGFHGFTYSAFGSGRPVLRNCPRARLRLAPMVPAMALSVASACVSRPLPKVRVMAYPAVTALRCCGYFAVSGTRPLNRQD